MEALTKKKLIAMLEFFDDDDFIAVRGANIPTRIAYGTGGSFINEGTKDEKNVLVILF